jgi:class 3 adenylate cyclase/tetratricopeptide (TPR) repeat protein
MGPLCSSRTLEAYTNDRGRDATGEDIFSELAVETRAERRLVTCLFIDVVGSTELVGQIGAERMKRLLDQAFSAIRDLISSQGGTIEKYVGDAIFALFGATVAHADDAERALRAAVASTQWAEASLASPLAVRVGVETGEALVDLAGVGTERQRMVIGTCVNVAARLQQQADPGEVLVGPGCHEATAHVAEFESIGSHQVKGLGVIPIWRLLRVGDVHPGSALPFVGRQEELGRLRSAYDRACSSRATLALVIGPPGQGKTRLAEEFVRDVRSDSRLLQARCRPGGETGSWTPMKQLLAADIPDPTAERVADRIDSLLNGHTDTPRVTKALCHGAGLLVDDRLLSLRPFEREQEIAQAWRHYLAALGVDGPVVLWIEDVHWAEPQLVRLIDRLTLGQSLPLLVLMTGRPEFAGAAMLRPAEDRVFLELERLDRAASLALARSAGAIDDRTAERAEGHPLFIIELVRSHVGSHRDLPLTVQAAIAARLDELAPPERRLLQRVAVAGDTFTIRDAALLSDREPAEVAGMLARVAHLRYLYPVGQAYRFHHVLVRDVGYARLPVEERMHLHARYAQEGVDPSDVEALAHHWWEALLPPDAGWVWNDAREREEMLQEAMRAHLAAGRRLSERFERERALEVYDHALKLARNPQEDAVIETAIAMAYIRDGLGDEGWEHRLRAIASYREAGADPPASLYVDMLETPTLRWGFFRTLPPEDLVLRLLDEGQRVARAGRSTASLALLMSQHAAFDSFNPDIANEAVRLTETWTNPTEVAGVLQRAARVLIQAGEIEGATATYERMDRFVASGGQVEEMDALMWRALLTFLRGDLVGAEVFADRLSERTATSNAHWRTHAQGTKGLVLFGRGDWAAVEANAAEAADVVWTNPGVGFCLIGAAAFAYGAAAKLLRGEPLPTKLQDSVERCIPESPAVAASTLLIPYAMSRRGDIDTDAFKPWRPGRRPWDTQEWDPFGLAPAIALTIRESWDALEEPLHRLEEVSRKGARMCGALAAAIREEMDHARGGPPPNHAALRDLGYRGLSELMSFRPGMRIEAGTPAVGT